MYRNVATKLVSIMRHSNPDLNNADLREVSAYGIELTLSTIVNYLLVSLIGMIFSSLISVILFSVIFNTLRKYIGGYHCTTYFRCNVTFCLIFAVILLSSYILCTFISISMFIMILLFCGYGIWYWGPVENIYKPISSEQQKRCHTIAKSVYIVDCLVAIVCYIWLPYYGLVAMFTLLAVVILLPLGTVAERRRRYDAQKESRKDYD